MYKKGSGEKHCFYWPCHEIFGLLFLSYIEHEACEQQVKLGVYTVPILRRYSKYENVYSGVQGLATLSNICLYFKIKEKFKTSKKLKKI